MNTELRIDGIAKTLAAGQTRRGMLRGLGAGVLGAAVKQAISFEAGAATRLCKRSGARCKTSEACCSGRCRRRRCRCSRFEQPCRSNSDCCGAGGFKYCDLRCLDPDCQTCAATDQPTGFCKDDAYC